LIRSEMKFIIAPIEIKIRQAPRQPTPPSSRTSMPRIARQTEGRTPDPARVNAEVAALPLNDPAKELIFIVEIRGIRSPQTTVKLDSTKNTAHAEWTVTGGNEIF